MTKIFSAIQFIHICNERSPVRRIELLSKNLGINKRRLQPYNEHIQSLMDFIDKIDNRCHRYETSQKENLTFFNQAFHINIASDLIAMITLGITGQNFQINIILRHLIEVFVTAVWADITSYFKGSFDYVMETKIWKKNRSLHLIYWESEKKNLQKSLKERLERIRQLNLIKARGRIFYKKYFSSASEADLQLLLSLPICDQCKRKYKEKIYYKKFNSNPNIRKKGKEHKGAIFKTDFRHLCSFCNKTEYTKGYAVGVPDTSDMIKMSKKITNDKFATDLAVVEHIYSYMSDNYIHFSGEVVPHRKPKVRDFGSGSTTFRL